MASTKIVAPKAIPQDLQAEIVALAVLKAHIDRASGAYERMRERVAAKLIAGVEVRP